MPTVRDRVRAGLALDAYLPVFASPCAKKDFSAWAQIEDFAVGAIRFAGKTAAAAMPD